VLLRAPFQVPPSHKDDIVLIPQPSDDPNDPLNWAKWKKAVAFSSILVFATLSNWVIAGLGFAIPQLLETFQHDLNSTSQGLIGSCILTLGMGVNRSASSHIERLTDLCAEFLLGSNCSLFRKRPAFLCASLLFFGAIIWSATATSFTSLVAARVIYAFAASSTEGLAAALNADLFFLHERGWWMGVYLVFLNLGPTLGSLVSGFIIQALEFRWHFWVGTA
jgi:MFS family permease